MFIYSEKIEKMSYTVSFILILVIDSIAMAKYQQIREIDLTDKLHSQRPPPRQSLDQRDIVINMNNLRLQRNVEAILSEIDRLITKLTYLEQERMNFSCDQSQNQRDYEGTVREIIQKLHSCHNVISTLNKNDPIERNLHIMLYDKIMKYLEIVRNKHQAFQDYTLHQDERMKDLHLDFGEPSRFINQQESEVTFQQDNINEHIIMERSAGINQIATSIQSLAEMMRDLNMLVLEQQPMIDNIETNVLATREHVIKGNEELGKAQEYGEQHKKKLCCLLILVALIFIVVLIIILKLAHVF